MRSMPSGKTVLTTRIISVLRQDCVAHIAILVYLGSSLTPALVTSLSPRVLAKRESCEFATTPSCFCSHILWDAVGNRGALRVLKTWRSNRASVVAAEERRYTEMQVVILVNDWYLVRRKAWPWTKTRYLQTILAFDTDCLCTWRSKVTVRITNSAHAARSGPHLLCVVCRFVCTTSKVMRQFSRKWFADLLSCCIKLM